MHLWLQSRKIVLKQENIMAIFATNFTFCKINDFEIIMFVSLNNNSAISQKLGQPCLSGIALNFGCHFTCLIN